MPMVGKLASLLFTTTFWIFLREFSSPCRHRVAERSDGLDYLLVGPMSARSFSGLAGHGRTLNG